MMIPSDTTPLYRGKIDSLPHDIVSTKACIACRNNEPLEFEFEYAYQPIVNVSTRSIYAHEALVRGPNGESAASILAKINDGNRYKFDQLCRSKAVEGAARLI